MNKIILSNEEEMNEDLLWQPTTYAVAESTEDCVAVTGITLSQTSLTLEPYTNTTLVATIEPCDATEQRIIWLSSDTSVAMVDSGFVCGRNPGETKITSAVVHTPSVISTMTQ